MIKKVGVVGCGQMGSGITQVSAQAGYQVVVNEATEEFLAKGIKGITKQLDKAIEKGKLDQAGKEKVLGNIKGTTEFAPFADCDIVIEAVTENMGMKKEIFKELDKICKAEAILASNTSSLPVGDLASVTKRRDKFLGLHFFNPVQVMKLVEVVKTIDTSKEAYDTAFAFAQSLGKSPVKAKDSPGIYCQCAVDSVSAGRDSSVREWAGLTRGYRQRHDVRLRASDGAAHADRFYRSGHDALYRGYHVRGVQGQSLCGAAASSPDGQCRIFREEVRSRFL